MADTREVDVASLINHQKFGWFQVSIVLWAWAVMFIEGYDMQVTAYAAPAIIKEWHVNRAYFGPVFGFGLFGYMLGATILSNLADRLGRKKLIIAGFLIFGVFTVASGFSASLTELLVLRFVAGLGLGCSIPCIIALGAEYAPVRLQATAISLLFIGYNIGGTVGGLIAAKFIPAFGWPSVFFLGGLAPIAIAVLLFFALPESVRFLALQEGGERQVASILSRLRPDQSFDSNTRFILHEEKRSGLPVKHLFTEGRALMTCLLWLAFVTSLLGHYFLTSWLPTLLVSVGVSLSHAVIVGGLIQGGGAIGCLAIGVMLDRHGVSAVAVSFALAVPFVVLLGMVGPSFLWLSVLATLVGLCLLGGQVGLNALSGTFYPTYIRSTGAGWAFGVGRVGSILGPLLGAVLISFKFSNSMLMVCAAVPAVCCAAATFALGRTRAASSASEQASLEPVISH